MVRMDSAMAIQVKGRGVVVAGGEVVLDRSDEVGRGWQVTKSSCRMSWRAVPGLLAFFTLACAVKPANANKASKPTSRPAKQWGEEVESGGRGEVRAGGPGRRGG